jgi:signal transduction histidine kinase
MRHIDLNGQPFGSRKLLDAQGFAQAKQGEESFHRVLVSGEPALVRSIPAINRGEIVGVVQAAYPLGEMERTLRGLDTALLTLIPVGLLGAAAGGAFLTDRVLRRVRVATQAAGRIGREAQSTEAAFAQRLPVAGNDEFSELAQTFNGLLDRLENAHDEQSRLLQMQRRFTADASHELKTPLTVIQGTASMNLARPGLAPDTRESLQQINEAAKQMHHLVQDLLLLARSDGGQMARAPIELLVTDLVERARSGMGENRKRIVVAIDPPDQTVRGNENELVRVFTNLLSNALRYSPEDSVVSVTAKTKGPTVKIAVSDKGIGIAPHHLARLGERFYRVDAARTRQDGGSGLGLSICKSIVEAHGGRLQFQSAEGVGTVAEVLLPRA